MCVRTTSVCPVVGKAGCCVVASSISLASAQGAKARSFRCSSFPHAIIDCAGTPVRQPPFPSTAARRYNTLDLAGKVVCHETAGFFGFFRPRERRPLWNPRPTGASRPYWKPHAEGLPPLWTPCRFLERTALFCLNRKTKFFLKIAKRVSVLSRRRWNARPFDCTTA